MDAHCNYQWLSSACYMAFGILHITTLTGFAFTILGAFAKLRKVNISVVRSVCLSVCLSAMEQISSHWTDLHAIYQYFQKSVKKFKFA
jgi:transcriptional regulatory protein LevR